MKVIEDEVQAMVATKSNSHTELEINDLVKCAPFSNPPKHVTIGGHTCEQVMNDKIIIAGAVSSNHFKEVQDMIGSVQHFYPNLHIIIYNLGLSDEELGSLAAYCNVHVRQFNFDKYPDFVSNLQVYSWKPLLVLELSKEYDVIFYFDSSVRLLKPFIDIAVPMMSKFPFIPGSVKKNAGNFAIVKTTHDGMLRYLNITKSREQLQNFGLVEAGLWGMWVNNTTVSKILKPWVECALHIDCIAPKGAHLTCHTNVWTIFWKTGLWISDISAIGAYRGCHKYDQSALNMILLREYGFEVWDVFSRVQALGAVKVERHVTSHYTVNVCKE